MQLNITRYDPQDALVTKDKRLGCAHHVTHKRFIVLVGFRRKNIHKYQSPPINRPTAHDPISNPSSVFECRECHEKPQIKTTPTTSDRGGNATMIKPRTPRCTWGQNNHHPVRSPQSVCGHVTENCINCYETLEVPARCEYHWP